MMYRPHIQFSHLQPPESSEHKEVKQDRYGANSKRHFHLFVICVMACCIAVAIYGFYQAGHRGSFDNATVHASSTNKAVLVEMNRLCRNQIPKLNLNTINYRELFNDTNATQLVAAQRNGLKHPELVSDPSLCDELFPIVTNDLYIVDTMKFSKPYLVPNAVRMLEYIGERFQQLMQENYPGKHYRFIVTSALRSQSDVSQLRRRNRNASEVSCHCYGTTVDITYIRFRDDNGIDDNELYLKNILAQTLYELRYEGICYVKYERVQGCFHLTLLTPEYYGRKKSERIQYAALSCENPTQIVKHKHLNEVIAGKPNPLIHINQHAKSKTSSVQATKQVQQEQSVSQKESVVKGSKKEYTNFIIY